MDPRELTTAVPRFLIRVYQALSSGMPHRCRFTPSCSQYMADALLTKGLLKGFTLGTRRILKCHPFHSGGYDPIDVTPTKVGVQSIDVLDSGLRRNDTF